MSKIRYDLYRQKVKVILKNEKEFIGVFDEDFEDEKEIAINNVIIKYDEIKKMERINDCQNSNEVSANFYNDYLYKKILIIKASNEYIEEKIDLENCIVLSKNDENISYNIYNSDLIILIGNVDVDNSLIKDKFIICINTINYKGYHTCLLNVSSKEECMKIIKSIHNAIYIPDFIQIDLYDIATGLNGRFKFHSFKLEEKEDMYNVFTPTSKLKVFIIFEIKKGILLEKLSDIVEEVKEKYKNCEFGFGMTRCDEVDSNIKINVFYEIK